MIERHLLMPTQVALELERRQLLEGLNRLPKVLLHYSFEFVNTPLLNHVLHTRHSTIIPAAIVTLRSHYCLHNIQYVLLCHIAQFISQPWKSLLHSMCPAHTSTDLINSKTSKVRLTKPAKTINPNPKPLSTKLL